MLTDIAKRGSYCGNCISPSDLQRISRGYIQVYTVIGRKQIHIIRDMGVCQEKCYPYLRSVHETLNTLRISQNNISKTLP